MKIKYLGTGAAEGIPAIFCECDICKYARIKKGKEIRSRSQAIIDDKILIDFGSDAFMHSIKYNLDYSKFDTCLITHAHDDHLYRHDLICRKKNRALLSPSAPPLAVFGGQNVKDVLKPDDNGFVTKDGNVIYKAIHPYQQFKIHNYLITALPAVHKTKEPLVYIFEKNNSSILYCHDSDILDESSIEFIKKNNIKFDLVSLDCTEGKKIINYQGHMNFQRNVYMRDLLLKKGLASSNTLFIANHFSHNGKVTYDEAVKIGKEIGFIIAYDGMEVSF